MMDQAKKYLSDILQAISLIEGFTEEITDFGSYQYDLKTKSAVERQLGIIGEAVNQYSKLEDPWELTSTRQIVNFRNRLVHSYDKVDDSIVWVILKRHIPDLKLESEKGLKM